MSQINSIIIFILALVVIIVFRFGPRAADGTRPLISSYNVFLLLFSLYVVFSASLSIIFNGGQFTWAVSVSDPTYIFGTLIVCSYALFLFVIGYGSGMKRISSRQRAGLTYITPQYSRGLIFCLIMFGVLLKIYVIFSLGGVSESLVRLSNGLRQSLRIEQVNPLIVNMRTLSGIADAGAVWALLLALRRKSEITVAIAVFSFVMLLSYFSIGKRLILVWPFLSVALGYHFYVRRLTISKVPWLIAGVILFGFGSLLFRVFLPAFTANVDIDLRGVSWANGSLLSFYFYSPEYSTFEMMTLSVFEANRIVGLFGGAFDAFVTTNIVPFFYAVPRFLWPGKPEVFLDISHALNAILTGVPVQSSTVGVAETLIGSSWALGSFPGLTLAMYFFGRMCNWVDQPLRSFVMLSPRGIVIFSFFINIVLHTFRQGTLGWVFIIAVVQQYGMIIGYLLIFVVAQTRIVALRKQRFGRVQPPALVSDAGPRVSPKL